MEKMLRTLYSNESISEAGSMDSYNQDIEPHGREVQMKKYYEKQYKKSVENSKNHKKPEKSELEKQENILFQLLKLKCQTGEIFQDIVDEKSDTICTILQAKMQNFMLEYKSNYCYLVILGEQFHFIPCYTNQKNYFQVKFGEFTFIAYKVEKEAIFLSKSQQQQQQQENEKISDLPQRKLINDKKSFHLPRISRRQNSMSDCLNEVLKKNLVKSKFVQDDSGIFVGKKSISFLQKKLTNLQSKEEKLNKLKRLNSKLVSYHVEENEDKMLPTQLQMMEMLKNGKKFLQMPMLSILPPCSEEDVAQGVRNSFKNQGIIPKFVLVCKQNCGVHYSINCKKSVLNIDDNGIYREKEVIVYI